MQVKKLRSQFEILLRLRMFLTALFRSNKNLYIYHIYYMFL